MIKNIHDKPKANIGSLWCFDNLELVVILGLSGYSYNVYSMLIKNDQHQEKDFFDVDIEMFDRWIGSGKMVCLNDGK